MKYSFQEVKYEYNLLFICLIMHNKYRQGVIALDVILIFYNICFFGHIKNFF
ncbi:hypothetical protein SAMN05216327_11264 [Dyadobacter sp. SG02]|nr:hypothetical protein SAMN05216327_11264 [Dyadobacter sp. SG02]